MKFSQIKELRDLIGDDWREAVEQIEDGEADFTVGETRFIRQDEIDQIMQDELESEPYILGAFNAWFLADILNVSSDTIEKMQKVEAFEALGELILGSGKLEELQKAYASADGYGHHFNSWDGSETEFNGYHVFVGR